MTLKDGRERIAVLFERLIERRKQCNSFVISWYWW